MKGVGLAVAAAVVLLAVDRTSAVKVFTDEFNAVYVDAHDDDEFAGEALDRKCNVCHYGKKKSQYNAYGVALAEFLKRKDYTTSRVREEPEKVSAEVRDAFAKVEQMTAPCGETWGALLNAGKLPADERHPHPDDEADTAEPEDEAEEDE